MLNFLDKMGDFDLQNTGSSSSTTKTKSDSSKNSSFDLNSKSEDKNGESSEEGNKTQKTTMLLVSILLFMMFLLLGMFSSASFALSSSCAPECIVGSIILEASNTSATELQYIVDNFGTAFNDAVDALETWEGDLSGSLIKWTDQIGTWGNHFSTWDSKVDNWVGKVGHWIDEMGL